MNHKNSYLGLLLSVLLLGAGCASSELSTSNLSDSTKSVSLLETPCGDGVCDAAEQEDAALCPADCKGVVYDEEGKQEEADTSEFVFVPDDGIRVEDASNAGVKKNADGSVSLVFQSRSTDSRGRNDVAVAQASSDWLTFTRTDEGVNPAQFRALKLPDGTCRAYGLDATKSGVMPGSNGLKSQSSEDCVTYTEDAGTRYTLTDSDNGSMGVYDLFIDSNENVVLLYLADLKGLNNLRRAVSTDGGWTFIWQADDVLGDAVLGGGGQSYVDNKVIVLKDGREFMVAMRQGKIYTFISEDDGVTWTKNSDELTPDEFGAAGVKGLYDPQIVQLADGRFRIYVTGETGGTGADDPNATQHIYSATTTL